VELARHSATAAHIQLLVAALEKFRVDNGRYPTTAQGLDALVHVPMGLSGSWKGPYIDNVSTDKWGRAYDYRMPGASGAGDFDLTSSGRDGNFGTDDDLDKFTLD
jgi:general secretion pathway protein G